MRKDIKIEDNIFDDNLQNENNDNLQNENNDNLQNENNDNLQNENNSSFDVDNQVDQSFGITIEHNDNPSLPISNELGNCVKQQITDFNYKKTTAEQLFRIQLEEPIKYKQLNPLKGIGANFMYTIKDCALEDITCDDNGAYHRSNSVKIEYHIKSENGLLSANIIHEGEEGPIFKTRKGRNFIDNIATTENIFLLNRYSRFNKTIPQLRMMVVRVL